MKLLISILIATALWAQPVTVNGYVKYADGTPFQGIVRISLPRPAITQTGTTHVSVPTQYIVTVPSNGVFSGSLYPTQYYTVTNHFRGTGLNDVAAFYGGGMILLPADQEMIVCVQIDSTGATDTFSWGSGAFSIASATAFTAVSCTNGGTKISLSPMEVLGYGLALMWVQSSGHTLGDAWGWRIRQALSPQEFYQTTWYVGNNVQIAQFNISVVPLSPNNVSFLNLALASVKWH